jgi:RNA polymerase sigma-70 factor (ECF subfamily)
MLGSLSEADDAIQEVWLRLSRSDAAEIENLGGWLTTVVARVCLDMLRSRSSRREDALDPQAASTMTDREHGDPEHEALLADSVGLALLVVLDRLTPAERLAFVMHDMFAVSFEEIGAVVGRSPAAARQLASRARRRVQGAGKPDADLAGQRQVIDAFLTALRAGDLDGLLAVLDPDVVVRVDAGAAGVPGPAREVRGAANWARGAVAYAQAMRFAEVALVDGEVGLILAPRGQLFRVLRFRVANEKIVAAEVVAEPERLSKLEVSMLEP